jgi:integrase
LRSFKNRIAKADCKEKGAVSFNRPFFLGQRCTIPVGVKTIFHAARRGRARMWIMEKIKGMPYELDKVLYLKFLSAMYSPRADAGSVDVESNFQYLEYILKNWDYWKDQRFFNTALTILLLGCRINEVSSVRVLDSFDFFYITLYAKKQKVKRIVELSKFYYRHCINEFFSGNFICLNEREFNRRFRRYFPLLAQIAESKKMHAGSHVLRHIHICSAFLLARIDPLEIQKQMCWKSLDIFEGYTVLIDHII